LRYRILFFAILIFLVACNSQQKGPPYIKEIAPLSKIPGIGVSFVIPNEKGWMLFDPDGKGSFISKFGQTKIESYIISLDCYQQSIPETVSEFKKLYKVLEQRETESPRYKPLLIQEQLLDTHNKFAIKFHYLVEDHQPKEKPIGYEYMLLETMGYFVVHPNIPDNMVRIAYSHRYVEGHEDPKFKEKAKWVLDQVVFTNQ
jgi:hypothetical protein